MSRNRTPYDTEVIAKTYFVNDMDVEVSTIAIYCVGSYVSEEPLVYETMIFAKHYPEIDENGEGGIRDAHTREGAIEQHNRSVDRVERYFEIDKHTTEYS